MTLEERQFLDKINQYAENVLKDIEPQKTLVSTQIEKLKPVMEMLAKENDLPLEEIFIKYMDLQSELSAENEQKFKEQTLSGPDFISGL
ncbi:MAG TPA: hypothetical protein PLU43_03155 [Lachnospiraceae bacterium]|nr:hypothetical protein [Lachnospiraceae bacterium]